MTVDLQQKHAMLYRANQLREIATLLRRYRVTIQELTEYLNGYQTTSEALSGLRSNRVAEQRRATILAEKRAQLAKARASRFNTSPTSSNPKEE